MNSLRMFRFGDISEMADQTVDCALQSVLD